MSKKRNKKRNNNNIKEIIKRDTDNASAKAAGKEDIETGIEAAAAAAEIGADKIEESEAAISEMAGAEEAVLQTAEAKAPEIEAAALETAVTELEAFEIDMVEAEAAEISEDKIEALDAALNNFAIDDSDTNEPDAKTDDIAADDIDYIKTDDSGNIKASADIAKIVKKERPKYQRRPEKTLSEKAKLMAVSGLKVLVPAALCIIVIFAVISLATSKKDNNTGGEGQAQSIDEPLKENAYENVNEFIGRYFKALSEGDTNTITSLMDYVDSTSLITYEKKSEYIAYANIACYTKPGLEENSYFAYVTYDANVNGIDTSAPGLNAFYIYTAQDGSLKIDGDRDERIEAAFKLATSQDDVVDLYNRIDVKYNEAVSSDEALKTFMDEFPGKVKTAVGEALAQIEGNNSETSSSTESETDTQQDTEQDQPLNQRVRATVTVNVRKSDSEEADRVGSVLPGTELTRVEDKLNGWSKVIYEGKEAYIKSDYLEIVSTETADTPAGDAGAAATPSGFVKAKVNVNVRNGASQDSQKIGVTQAGKTYEVVENLGEWYKIKYNGTTGYVKAELFE